jgi:hypothetical protein
MYANAANMENIVFAQKTKGLVQRQQKWYIKRKWLLFQGPCD